MLHLGNLNEINIKFNFNLYFILYQIWTDSHWLRNLHERVGTQSKRINCTQYSWALLRPTHTFNTLYRRLTKSSQMRLIRCSNDARLLCSSRTISMNSGNIWRKIFTTECRESYSGFSYCGNNSSDSPNQSMARLTAGRMVSSLIGPPAKMRWPMKFCSWVRKLRR